jgi:CheY-like chemotaxis protein
VSQQDVACGERAAPHAVLVVDDHPLNRRLVGTLLERMGCRVTLAGQGAEAVALCAVQRFSLVLMDLEMPNLDGLQATRAIREGKGPSADTPIVAFTAHDDAAVRAGCAEAGVSDFLKKPAGVRELRGLLARWAPSPEVSEGS